MKIELKEITIKEVAENYVDSHQEVSRHLKTLCVCREFFYL